MTRFMRVYTFFVGIAVCLFFIFAQTAQTVEIEGRVLNAETKEPIPFANVRLLGTKLGASTDDEGRFKIGQITISTYTLQASCVGYQEVILKDVRIDSDSNRNFEPCPLLHTSSKKLRLCRVPFLLWKRVLPPAKPCLGTILNLFPNLEKIFSEQ